MESASLPSGVPDRYHLRPDLGGHPSAVQQQQQAANPQQVSWSYRGYKAGSQIQIRVKAFCLFFSLFFFQ